MDLGTVKIINNLLTYLVVLITFLLSSCASVPEQPEVIDLLASSPYPPTVKILPPQFSWPVIGGTMTRGYKKPKKLKPSRRWRKKHVHQGIDVAARRNTPIFAAHSGKVVHVGRDRLGYRGYGKLVIIKSENRQWKTYYAHLNKFRVKHGQKINKGQIVGLMGNTGRSRGTHLHFEIRKANEPIDPIEQLPYTPMISWQYSKPPLWQSGSNRATP